MIHESFNRTIVELKFSNVISTVIILLTFNRTIVELKHCMKRNRDNLRHLLILLSDKKSWN